MEIYTIYISCTVNCIQKFPLEAKLQEFKEDPYQKLLKEKNKFLSQDSFFTCISHIMMHNTVTVAVMV